MNLRLLPLFLLAPLLATASEDSRSFVLHNLHFQQFAAFGFHSPEVAHTVHQDNKGRLWIGTESGLFLYDGQEVRSFPVDANDPGKLPHDFIKAIAEGPDGRVWLGTWGGGLAYFDETTRIVRTIDLKSLAERNGLRFDPKIWSMAVDSKGRVWLGTFDAGLFRYDPASKELIAVYQPRADEHPRANRIDTLFIDSNDMVWFAPLGPQLHVVHADTLERPQGFADEVLDNPMENDPASDIGVFPDGRLFLLHDSELRIVSPAGKLLLKHPIQLHDSDSTTMEAVAYDDDSLLIGTGDRLWHFDLDSGDHFPIPAGRWLGAIDSSIVWDMDLTPAGDIVIGTSTGVWISPAASRQFWTISKREPEPVPLLDTRAIYRVNDKLYLNSENEIYEIEFDGELERTRVLKGKLFAAPDIGYPLWLEAAADSCFWIGSDLGLSHLCRNASNSEFLTRSNVHVLLRDEQQERILLQTNRGLGYIDPRVASQQIQFPAETAVRHATVHLSFGKHHDIWAGTFSGMHRYDRELLTPLPIFEENAVIRDWNDTFVNVIYPLDEQELLIGTASGLYHAQLSQSGAIVNLRMLFSGTPLEQVDVSTIIPAADSTVLLSTTFGFVRYDWKSGDTALLAFDDGVPNYQMYGGGFRYFVDGVAITSGGLGPLLFKPASLVFEQTPKRLAITDVLSFRDNQPKAWPTSGKLEFLHQDKVIRFKFGMLDYLMPENNRYEIRLNGFSNEWLDIGRLGEFNFTGLNAGEYRLEVRARDGVFPVEGDVSLDFSVLPPWWRTWWAYALYALIVLGSLTAYVLSLKRKIVREREISGRLREADRLKTNFLAELEEKVELATQDLRHAIEALEIKNVELDAAQQRALDASRLKSEFLANMSHEIRTPMNGVLGFTQLLRKSDLDEDQREYVETIEKSAMSLLGIINDVLDVSKIEAGKLIVDSTGFDLRQCLADTLEALAPVAYEKNLELIGEIDTTLPDGLRSDPTRLRQIVTNLVGNAVKFTESGHVHLHATRRSDDDGSERLQLRISDTGRGITPADRDRLFQAFERGSVDLAGRYTGTGLGLVITKKLCEAMGGGIELDSVPGKGTTITVELPLVIDRNPENRYGFGQPLAGRRVLVIDPYTQSREALRQRLAHWGAAVTAVAEPLATAFEDQEIVVLGVERIRLGDTRGLGALARQIPPALPKIVFAATIDREALRALALACEAPCLSKVSQPANQLRALRELLGATGTPATSTATASTRLSGLHVLVADDNRINRWFLKKILELHGARVSEADSGNAVLRRVDDQRAADIVLLDVHMPDIDGLEVARRLRARGFTRLPLLAVSANVQAETYDAALAAGINDYLLKPVEEHKLVEAVLEWTGREATVQEPAPEIDE